MALSGRTLVAHEDREEEKEKKEPKEKMITFYDFLSKRETVNEAAVLKSTETKVIKISFNIDWNDEIGRVDDEFTLAMSTDSTGLYTIGQDIEKYCGIPESDVIRDVAAGKDKPDGAIVYGMSNTMNGGADVYFWTNGTRLSGAAKQNGLMAAILEQVSHECVHLTRQILTRAIAKKKGADISKGEWITFDYGSGEYMWPAIGEDKKNPNVLIDEESFATSVGLVTQTVIPEFLKMASKYIPELEQLTGGSFPI